MLIELGSFNAEGREGAPGVSEGRRKRYYGASADL